MTLAWWRRRLGVLATFWLVGQVLSWSAVAAHLCCPRGGHEMAAMGTPGGDVGGNDGVEYRAHHAQAGAEGEADADADASCHTAVVDHCPMAGADGQPCPMHTAGTSADASATTAADCVMRGACTPSTSALLTLLWTPGVLVAPPAAVTALVSPLVLAPPVALSAVVLSHDPPPPRG